MPIARRLAIALLLVPSATLAAGGVQGTVTTDAKPSGKRLKVTKDQQRCGDSVADETILVKDGKLANVVVWVEGAPPTKVEPMKDVALDNLMCAFVPHVQAVTKGTRLPIKNSDPMLHNVHTYVKGDKTLFNLAMPLEGQMVKKRMKKTGIARVACDIHEWMSAYVHVFDHPFFAVTGHDGAFQIGGLPPGAYKLRLWHENQGEQSVDVTVTEGAALQVDINL